MDLIDTLEQVCDRDSFFAFVQALIEDREDEVAKTKIEPIQAYSAGANGWENATIETFLSAALAWAESTDMGKAQGLPEEPSWKSFATFLYLGKMYE